MQKGRLFVISGPSGTGKGTICKKIQEMERVRLSVSMTTRRPRDGEIHGIHYFFVSRDEFCRMIEHHEFLEYAEVYGNFYGTPKRNVLDMMDQGYDVVLEIDIQGALQVKEVYPEAVFIFILPPSMCELRRRLTERGSETQESLNLRMGETLKEIGYIDQYDYYIVNEQLAEAVERVMAIMLAEHSRISEDIYRMVERYKEEL